MSTGWTLPTEDAKKKRKKWPWIVGGIAVVFIVIIGSCAAIIGSAANTLNKEQQAHAISHAQFDAVHTGITHQQLLAQLKKQPQDSQEFVQKGVLTQGDLNSSCVYYNEANHTFGGAYFQFCFTGDSLTSKNAY